MYRYVYFVYGCKWGDPPSKDRSRGTTAIQNLTSGGATKCIIHQVSENSKRSVHLVQWNGISSTKIKSWKLCFFSCSLAKPRLVPQLFCHLQISKHVKTLRGESRPAVFESRLMPPLFQSYVLRCPWAAWNLLQGLFNAVK